MGPKWPLGEGAKPHFVPFVNGRLLSPRGQRARAYAREGIRAPHSPHAHAIVATCNHCHKVGEKQPTLIPTILWHYFMVRFVDILVKSDHKTGPHQPNQTANRPALAGYEYLPPTPTHYNHVLLA